MIIKQMKIRITKKGNKNNCLKNHDKTEKNIIREDVTEGKKKMK